MIDMPYFMQNKSWYEYDFKKKKYVLTKEAPKRAIESYKEFYKEFNKER